MTDTVLTTNYMSISQLKIKDYVIPVDNEIYIGNTIYLTAF
jgi:hypothetical protein